MCSPCNLRAVGGFLTASGQYIKNGIVIRSANLDNLDSKEVQEIIRRYSIKAIFDLRDQKETNRENNIGLGVPTYQLSALDQMGRDAVATYFQDLDGDVPAAFTNLYMQFCALSGPAFEKIFTHLRDNPGDSVLVHCELGKDRTGVFVAILLLVLEAYDDDIIYDYKLSQPQIESIMDERAVKLRRHPLVMHLLLSPTAIRNHFLALPENMQQFLCSFREKYGSGAGYVRSIGLDDNDIALIRKNLTEIKSG